MYEASRLPTSLPEDVALREIVEGVESETGDRFFASLVRHLASALGVQYAFVSSLSADRLRFRTLAVWGRGAFLANIEIPVAGTPCEQVLRGRMSHHPERLLELYPEDRGLFEWGVESYCGVPLLDSGGQVVGHLAIFDDKPMHDPRGVAIMRIFAARARAEVERLQAERALRASEERLARILASAMDAIVTFDAAHCVELFNEAAEKVFRVPAREAIGTGVERLLDDASRAVLDRALGSLPATGESGAWVWLPAGMTGLRADGSGFPLEGTLSAVEVGGRRLYTAILRDVDERRRAEEELQRLGRQNEYLQEELKAVHNFEEIVGQSRALTAVLETVQLVAATDSSVLILGETGTGKELVARAVHSGSPRRRRPLIKVNCAALPTGLIESELFGHERGAFTGATERRVGRFELANGGTLFLDEVGEMPPEVQVKLLRVLQEREFERIGGREPIRVDVRVIAATNRDLAREVAEGRFRQDLFYRLNVFPVPLPPLRERRDDVPLLVHYFVQRYAAKIGRRITRVPRETIERLVAYDWPGNVRELENVIERAVILSPGPDLQLAADAVPAGVAAADHATPPGRAATPTPPGAADDAIPAAPPLPVAERPSGVAAADPASLEDLERMHIARILQRTGWRIEGPKGAARLLDMHPSTLRSRIKKLRIQRGIEGEG